LPARLPQAGWRPLVSPAVHIPAFTKLYRRFNRRRSSPPKMNG
jgi:hypothetical protein